MICMSKDESLYRQGVVGMIRDPEGNYLIVQHIDYGKNQWRFPGGGIEEGEKPEEALLRELSEELGTDKFEIVGKSKNLNRYDWPDGVIDREFQKRGKKYCGQEQVQYLLKFSGVGSEIKPDPKEIKRIKWVKYEDLKNYFVFPNQWETAEKALDEFVEI